MSEPISIYGSVVFRGQHYHNDEIANIPRNQRMLYGIDWVYAGDCFFEECGFVVGAGTGKDFYGRNGLKEALAYYDMIRLV